MSNVLKLDLLNVQDAGRLVARMLQLRELSEPSRDQALRAISTSHSLPFSFLWSLLYRPPRRLEHTLVMRLLAAYRSEVKKAADALELELVKAGAVNALDQHQLDEAQDLLALARRKLEKKA